MDVPVVNPEPAAAYVDVAAVRESPSSIDAEVSVAAETEAMLPKIIINAAAAATTFIARCFDCARDLIIGFLLFYFVVFVLRRPSFVG